MLQLQPYLLTMASKQLASTSTFMVKEQGPMPQQQILLMATQM